MNIGWWFIWFISVENSKKFVMVLNCSVSMNFRLCMKFRCLMVIRKVGV